MKLSKIQSTFLLIFIILCQHGFSQYIPFCDKGKWGFATTDGKTTIACLYEAVDFYSDDNLAKVKKGGKYGYINKKGVAVIPFEYDDCFRIYEVYEGANSFGIKINPSVHLNDEWSPSDTKNNRYIVFKNKNCGIISLIEGKPKVLVPFNYSKIQFDLNKKIFHCSNKKGMQYFNIDGQRLTQEQVNNIESIEYATVEKGVSDNIPKIIKINGKVGVIQQSNNSWGKVNYDTIVPVIYDDIITEKFDDDYFRGNDVFGVKIGKKWGIVDREKNILLPINFDSINFELSKDSRHWAEYKRMVVVKKNGLWGILGKKNDGTDTITTLLPFEYEAIRYTIRTY